MTPFPSFFSLRDNIFPAYNNNNNSMEVSPNGEGERFDHRVVRSRDFRVSSSIAAVLIPSEKSHFPAFTRKWIKSEGLEREELQEE